MLSSSYQIFAAEGETMTRAMTVRMDDELGAQFAHDLDALGLTANAYFVMAAKQLVMQRRVPFDLVVPVEVPTEETRAALVLAEAKELGLVPDDSPCFDSVDAAMAWLDS